MEDNKLSSQNPALWLSNVRLCINVIEKYLKIEIGTSYVENSSKDYSFVCICRISPKVIVLFKISQGRRRVFEFCFQILLDYTKTQLSIPLKLRFVMKKFSASILGFET